MTTILLALVALADGPGGAAALLEKGETLFKSGDMPGCDRGL
jgi:hypothetical protein